MREELVKYQFVYEYVKFHMNFLLLLQVYFDSYEPVLSDNVISKLTTRGL